MGFRVEVGSEAWDTEQGWRLGLRPVRDKFIKLCSQVDAGKGRLKGRVWQVVSVWVLLLSEQVVHVYGCGCKGHPDCRGTSKNLTKHLTRQRTHSSC